MNHFNLIEFARILRTLQYGESTCESLEVIEGPAHVNETLIAEAIKVFDNTMALAKQLGNQDLYDIAATSHTNVKNRPQLNVSGLRVYFQGVKDGIAKYAFYGKFLYIEKDRSGMLDKPDLLGSQIPLAFPNAIQDIRDAGNCLAAECNTAAVFHLMRVVEWGLRYLCVSLGLKQLKQTTKAGKVKVSPLSYSEWEDILNQAQLKIDAKLRAAKRGTAKQRDQQFYYPILQDISGIRDAWRNHVMHTRAEYNRSEANAVLDHVTRIMTRLSERAGVRTKKIEKLPTIISAKWGVGGDEYREVTDLLRGYLSAGTKELRAANEFFVDHYPGRFKHLIVEYTLPGRKAVKSLTFQEGALIRFQK